MFACFLVILLQVRNLFAQSGQNDARGGNGMDLFTVFDATKPYKRIWKKETETKAFYFRPEGWGFTVCRLGIPVFHDAAHSICVETGVVGQDEITDFLDEGEGGELLSVGQLLTANAIIQLADFSSPVYELFDHYIDAVNSVTGNGSFSIVRLE